jgi:hypothetical protein
MQKIIYKGKEIEPYESFYYNATEAFFHGTYGGGISRCVKCDDSLAILVEDERNAEEQKAGTDDGKVLRG